MGLAVGRRARVDRREFRDSCVDAVGRVREPAVGKKVMFGDALREQRDEDPVERGGTDERYWVMKEPDAGPCPFCGEPLGSILLSKTGPALYAYEPCGCPVQFDAEGYPHHPRDNGSSFPPPSP